MLASELIQAVRDITDESNTNDVSPEKILGALNRALQRLARLSVRHYPELLKRELVAQATSQLELPVLSQAYHQMQVDVRIGDTYRPLTYTSPVNTVGIDAASATAAYPLYYGQEGNVLRFYPPCSGANIRVKYELKPPKLVLEQGRITSYDSDNGYIYIDSIGTGLSTSVSTLGAFFNVIDQHSGDIKATMQLAAKDASSGRLTIKTSGLGRSSVYGREVDTALPTSIAQDDYVCLASGSCIPLYFREYTDFLVQHAANDIKRTFGTLADADVYAFKDIEDDVKLMWSGRPYGARIKANNPAWRRARFFR